MEQIWNNGGKKWTYEYKFRKNGKTLCAFYFKENTLGFMIIFGKAERTKVEEIKNELSSDVLETYDQGGSLSPPPCGRQPPVEQRRRHRRGQRLLPGPGCTGNLQDLRHDHGCGQLHVRQCPGYEPGGRSPVRGALHSGAGAVRPVLPPNFRCDL